MNKEQIVIALELLNQGLEIRYAERAMLSIAPGHYILLEKKEDGSVVQTSSDSAMDIVAMLVDQTDAEKTQTAKINMLYAEYPRKIAVGYARSAIAKALKDTEIPVLKDRRFLYLMTAVKLVAKYHKDKGTPKEKIPYPATWFNGKYYLNNPEVVKRWMPKVAATLNASVSAAAKDLQMDFGSFAGDITP